MSTFLFSLYFDIFQNILFKVEILNIKKKIVITLQIRPWHVIDPDVIIRTLLCLLQQMCCAPLPNYIFLSEQGTNISQCLFRKTEISHLLQPQRQRPSVHQSQTVPVQERQ